MKCSDVITKRATKPNKLRTNQLKLVRIYILIVSYSAGPAGGLPLLPHDAGAAGGEVSGRGAPRAAQLCPRTQLHGSAGLQECLIVIG